jgi:hypothetical protein
VLSGIPVESYTQGSVNAEEDGKLKDEGYLQGLWYNAVLISVILRQMKGRRKRTNGVTLTSAL